MAIDPTNWPNVPISMRPKPLFVTDLLAEPDEAGLRAQGWDVQDLRLWPNTTITERQALVLAWLEGLRVGSITPTPRIYDTLELEAKVCGLTTMKQAPDKPKDLTDETIDNILGPIKNHRPTSTRI